MELRDLLHSAALWTVIWTVGLFTFLIFGARPVLRLLGMLFGLMGGPGLEGSGL